MNLLSLAALLFAFVAVDAAFPPNYGPPCPPGKPLISDPVEIEKLLVKWNDTMSKMQNIAVSADWNWASNLTDYNLRIKTEKSSELAKLNKDIWAEAICVNCTGVCNETTIRTINFYRTIDTSALPVDDFNEYMYISTGMEDLYGKAKVCKPKSKGGKCLPLDPDLTNLLENSRDYCELQWAWEGWRNESGRKMRGSFTAYVHLQNEAAKLNGFKSAKEMWTKSYWTDEEKFFDQMEAAYQQILPLYRELHAFARNRLRKIYKNFQFPQTGHIPAHLLGNMWAQDWTALTELLLPDPKAPSINIRTLLLNKNINATDLYHMSDRFFQSLGMEPMTNDFWEKSVLLKPKDVELVCHASAWDFYKLTDFRIKQCTEVTSQHFQTVHHEMGHIQYYMHYRDQPAEYRSGANPGFHEAIGDLIQLSVTTPDHLKAIDLLPKESNVTDGTYLNSMMAIALKKVVFLPFGYLIDKYRWDVFEKKIAFQDLNQAWWKTRCEMQGLSPPVKRSEDDFDPGAKYHVAASVPYDRYFFSHIVQFQFHVHICRKMGFTQDFHKCDIYNNSAALQEFREALRLGESKPYPEILKMMTGSDKLDASAFLTYFKPLKDFLEKENAANGEKPGWEPACVEPSPDVCDYDPPVPTTLPPAPTTRKGGAISLRMSHLTVATLLASAIALIQYLQ